MDTASKDREDCKYLEYLLFKGLYRGTEIVFYFDTFTFHQTKCILTLLGQGWGQNQPALFSYGYISMKKKVLDVPNFVTFPNSL